MIWINPTKFRDLEIAKVNPPYQLVADESCDNDPTHDLGDENNWYIPTYTKSGHEITQQRKRICSGCLRALLLAHYTKCPDALLMDQWVEAYAAERCSSCSLFRCECE